MVNEEQFFVYLYDRRIGILRRKSNFTRFVFDADYVNDPRRAVLGLRFEDNLHARHAANMRLPSWFSNLLPEGRLREWIGRARGVSVDREMEILAEVGHDLPGAVRVLEADSPVSIEESVGDDSASAATEGSLSTLWRFSLAGVGLKFSMVGRHERFMAPAVGEGGDWIVKLPEPDHAQVPRNEFAMMKLASAAGIEVPEVRLVHRDQVESLPDHVWANGETYAYAIRRFDRGLQRERIHIEDLAQVRGFYPEDKYRGTFETIGALIFRNHDVEALREFARRLAFNMLIGNGDAHLKNWSLIYRDIRSPTLAPAYDLVATKIYRPSELGPEDLGLKFGGTRRFDTLRLQSFSALEGRLRADAGLSDVVSSFVEAVVTSWPSVAEHFGEHTEMRDEIQQLVMQGAALLRR